MSKQRAFDRIDEHSDEYKPPQAKLDPVEVFGSNTLHSVEHATGGGGLLAVPGRPPETREQEIARHLERSRKQLLSELEGNPERFVTALQSSPLVMDISDAEQVRGLITSMSLEEYERFLTEYSDSVRTAVEHSAEQLADLESDFENHVYRAIAEDRLPADPEIVRRRIAETNVRFFDVIGQVARSDERTATLGLFEGETRTTEVFGNMDEKMVRHAYFHEMMHAISGRSIVQDVKREGSRIEQRVGLSFNAPKQEIEERGGERFRWFNEAITETLTIQLIGDEGAKYPEEREALELLLVSGKVPVDRSLILEAYFENYQADKLTEDRLPAWKALSQKLTEAYGPRFLLKLDHIEKRDGMSALINELRARR